MPVRKQRRKPAPKSGKLPPPRSHRISLTKAADLTARFRRYAEPTGEKTGFFHLKPVMELLTQPGCVGLRYYHGRDASGGYRIILVGVDAEFRDILGKRAVLRPGTGRKSARAVTALAAGGGDSLILEDHYICPVFCPPESPLNS